MSTTLIGIILVVIALIAICRELVCWYNKINKRISNQEKIIENQQQIIELLNKQVTRLDHIELNTMNKSHTL